MMAVGSETYSDSMDRYTVGGRTTLDRNSRTHGATPSWHVSIWQRRKRGMTQGRQRAGLGNSGCMGGVQLRRDSSSSSSQSSSPFKNKKNSRGRPWWTKILRDRNAKDGANRQPWRHSSLRNRGKLREAEGRV